MCNRHGANHSIAPRTNAERAKLLEDWSEAADERRKLVADFAAQFTPAGLTAFVEEADGQRAEAERRSKARLGELLAAKEALQAKLAFRRETEALILDLETSKKGLQERIAELKEEEKADAVKNQKLLALKAGNVRFP